MPGTTPPMSPDEAVRRVAQARETLLGEVHKVIIGQDEMIEQMLICTFARGHCLTIGVPGLAKTLTVSTLAEALHLKFSRIQFTPDLMPSDITGTEIIDQDQATGKRVFRFVRGPVFSNIVLADEINRAPPKTQAALLQAMQEQEVTVAGNTYKLEPPFFVMATQNPLEHHGTYPLPESQLDRFLMRITIGYPDDEAERTILTESSSLLPVSERLQTVLSPQQVVQLQNRVEEVEVDPAILDYLMAIVQRTRTTPKLRLGVSPRGSISIFRAARAFALTHGRTYLLPDDVRRLVVPCLAHRILPAGASGTAFDVHDEAAVVLEGILEEVEAPV